jgi:uncharacterized protein YutD
MSVLKFLRSTPVLLTVLFTVIFLASVILNSCDRPKTDKGGYPSDSLLKTLQKPVVAGPSEDEIKQVVETVKPQREALISTIDKQFPGLYKRYEAAVQELTKLKGEEKIANARKSIDSVYKKSFLDAYEKSGIAPALLESYKKMLSKYDYKVGDMGTISITQKQMSFLDEAPKPELTEILAAMNIFALMGCNGTDRTVTFNCPFDIQEQNSTCQVIGVSFTTANTCALSAGNMGTFIGGCGSFAKVGRNVDADGSFLNITSTFNANYTLHAQTWAVLGGAYCQAVVGSEIDEGSTVKVKNEFSKVWVVAPLIWYAESNESKTNQNMICSYHRTATTGTFTLTPKIYCEASAGAGGLVATGIPVSTINPITSLTVQMQH